MNLNIKGGLLDTILSTEDEELAKLKNYFDNINKLVDEEGKRLEDGDEFGLLKLDWVNNKEQVELILGLLKRILEVKKAEVNSSEGGGSSHSDDDPWAYGGAAWNPGYFDPSTGFIQTNGYDTGGYTGRWQLADTGMYTGEWPNGSVRRNGRLAWLH